MSCQNFQGNIKNAVTFESKPSFVILPQTIPKFVPPLVQLIYKSPP